MNATLTYRAQMVAVISLLCNDTKAGGSTVTSNFGSTVIVQNKHSEKKTHKKKQTSQSTSYACWRAEKLHDLHNCQPTLS